MLIEFQDGFGAYQAAALSARDDLLVRPDPEA